MYTIVEERRHVSQHGYTVDIQSRTVGGPDAGPFGLDDLQACGNNLYYARAIPNDHLITYQETWLFATQNWAITRFTFHEHLRTSVIDWKLEPDVITAHRDHWHVADGFIDLDLYEESHYHIEDSDELADALANGETTPTHVEAVLRALDALCRELRANGYSGRRLLDTSAGGLLR